MHDALLRWLSCSFFVQSCGGLDSSAYLCVYLAIVFLGHENVAVLIMLHVGRHLANSYVKKDLVIQDDLIYLFMIYVSCNGYLLSQVKPLPEHLQTIIVNSY